MRKIKKILAALAAMTMAFSGVNMTSFAENEKAVSTLKGDADLNGLVDLADLTTVAKYNLSNESYPLANDTAYANADMNDDGEVNGLDTSALIENQLGRERKTIDIPETDKTVELTAKVQPVSIQASKPSDKFENSQIDFAVELLKNTAEENTNTLVSPYSAAQALAMTANGAQKNTLNEMMNVIGGGMDIDSFNNDMAGFNSNLPNNEGCKLLTANSIWYHNDAQRFTPYEDFLKTNKSFYNAQVFSAPMNDETVNDVNAWVNEHTDSMIPKIIEKFDPDTIMALVNAVTFNGKWETAYGDAYKQPEYFTSADGKYQDADVLFEDGYMPYFKDEQASGFMKKYKGGRYAFAAILPDEGVSVNDYINGLTADKLNDLLSNAENCPIHTEIPKFTADYSKELNNTLQAMGIKDAFDETKADFTKMGKADYNGIHISKVIQKTHIEVDEGGTKAAASTVVGISAPTAAAPPETHVALNRPFVYAIVDTETNIPIFMGTLNSLE